MTFAAQTELGWTERNLTVSLESADLHGTLTAPNGTAKVPGVLLIVGSGPVDRNGNLPGAKNNCGKMLAHGLAECGIAAVRVDKRGIGLSAAPGLREQDLRFDQYVTDNMRWVAALENDSRIGQLFIIGHSEGALIGSLVAQRADVDGLVLIAGASVRAGELIRRQMARDGASTEMLEIVNDIIDGIDQGKLEENVPAALAPMFRPTVQPYLMSWFQVDPAAEFTKVRAPTLIIHGTTDLQVSADDARRLASVGKKASVAIIEGMNHILKESPQERAANLATYTNPSLPLHPVLLPTIVQFITKQAANRQ